MINPATGADRRTFAVGAVNRFATPALYDNAVFIGTLSGGIKAFNWS
jgi:hypothetical protein